MDKHTEITEGILGGIEEAYDWADIMRAAEVKQKEGRKRGKQNKVKDIKPLGRFKSLEIPKDDEPEAKSGTKPKATRRYSGLDYKGLTASEKKAMEVFVKKTWGKKGPKGDIKRFLKTRKKISIVPHKNDPSMVVVRLLGTSTASRKDMENFLTVLGAPTKGVRVGYKRTMAFISKEMIPIMKAIKEGVERFGDMLIEALKTDVGVLNEDDQSTWRDALDGRTPPQEKAPTAAP